ncbi:hypothetical protein FOZ63_017699, partial [Perkinsus olseni]
MQQRRHAQRRCPCWRVEQRGPLLVDSSTSTRLLAEDIPLSRFRKHEMLELGPDITIGIVGLGTIGTRVYELLRPFGCQFLAWSPDTRKDLPQLSYTNDVGELFQRSNLVTLHCKLTPQNYGFVNGPLLHRMQPGSILVNAA